MGDYYSVEKILSIIRQYHINMNNINTLMHDSIKSVGVSQYGLESSLPKANNISRVVENEVIRREENSMFFAEMLTDMKYLQDRWGRVSDEKEALVLQLRLDGHSISDIAEILKMTRSGVYRMIERIALQIKNYPQPTETKSTYATN